MRVCLCEPTNGASVTEARGVTVQQVLARTSACARERGGQAAGRRGGGGGGKPAYVYGLDYVTSLPLGRDQLRRWCTGDTPLAFEVLVQVPSGLDGMSSRVRYGSTASVSVPVRYSRRAWLRDSQCHLLTGLVEWRLSPSWSGICQHGEAPANTLTPKALVLH